ncbi:MAG: hypothetical protein WA716_09655, partial [Pseudolabrys sp.]
MIAFEDVGVASPDAVATTVASTDSSWRKESPKSRSAEHLITSADHHPSLAKLRMLRAAVSLALSR